MGKINASYFLENIIEVSFIKSIEVSFSDKRSCSMIELGDNGCDTTHIGICKKI